MVKKPRLFIALCTLPALILTIVFMIVPMVNAIYLSFTSSTALSVGFNSKFVFLDNYKYMFQDKDFLQALFNTLKLMLVIPAVTIFLSLVFAFILTQGQLKEKSFYRTVFFFPSIVSMTVVGIVWSFVFNPTRGILNHMLDLFHFSTWKHAWLGEGKTALWCIGAALVWQAIGYYMVMYMASMSSIPEHLYESASLDGAGKFRQFFSITLPMIWDNIRTTLTFFVISTINISFLLVNALTSGGPDGASQTVLGYIYKQAYNNASYGYGMAIAAIVFIFSFVLSFILNKSTERDPIEL